MRATLSRTIVLGVALIFWSVASAFAQLSADQSAEYNSWLALAVTAEAVIDNPNSTTATLQATRAQIVSFRDGFSGIGTENLSRINTLQGQLTALGAEPEHGEEAAEVADLRARLLSELDTLRVPVILAEESRNRASGLVQEIDNLLNNRLRSRLVRRDPTAFSLSNIAAAADDIGRTGFITQETLSLLKMAEVRGELRRRAPGLLALFAVSVYLMVRGLRLAGYVGARLREISSRGDMLWVGIEKILRVGLPFLGLLLLTETLSATGIFGIQTMVVLEMIPRWGVIVIGFCWIAYHVFSRRDGNALFDVTAARSTEVMALAAVSAIMVMARQFLEIYEQVEIVRQSTMSVLSFPIVTLQALLLFRLQKISIAGLRTGDTPTSETADSLPVLRRTMVGVLLLCVVAGAFGYMELSGGVVFALSWSTALIGVLLILQRMVTQFWAYVLRDQEGNRDQLLTAVGTIVLWAASMPVFAVIWGARPTQLSELWAQFLVGIQIGETRVSPTVFVTLLVIFALGVAGTRLTQAMLANKLLPKTRIDAGGQAAIVSGVGYVGYIVSAIISVTGAGLDLSSLAIVAGALSVGIGFGLQTIVSNFVSGVILLIERPVSKGDWISVGGQMGYVRDISVRSTRIETFDRTDVIVPNSDLISGTVVNYTRGNTIGRVVVPVGVAYGTETRMVEKVLLEIANAHPMVLANPAPAAVFQGFGADSLDFEIRAILRDVNWMLTVKSDINHEISRRFVELGIEIPFAQRDVWLRNPDVLAGNVAPPSSGPPASDHSGRHQDSYRETADFTNTDEGSAEDAPDAPDAPR
jgi:small-conductance mechanosensitive channel